MEQTRINANPSSTLSEITVQDTCHAITNQTTNRHGYDDLPKTVIPSIAALWPMDQHSTDQALWLMDHSTAQGTESSDQSTARATESSDQSTAQATECCCH